MTLRINYCNFKSMERNDGELNGSILCRLEIFSEIRSVTQLHPISSSALRKKV